MYLCRAIPAKKMHIRSGFRYWTLVLSLSAARSHQLSARDELRRCTSAPGKSGSPRRMACAVPGLRKDVGRHPPHLARSGAGQITAMRTRKAVTSSVARLAAQIGYSICPTLSVIRKRSHSSRLPIRPMNSTASPNPGTSRPFRDSP
jgi:hypothetical protein